MIEIKGNENIVSKEINVSSFVRLHILASGTIKIHKSDTEKVVIETDQNLMDYFEVENSGRTLYISSESKFKRPLFTSCSINVFVRNIDTLYISNENASLSFNEEIPFEFPINIKIQEANNVSMSINAPHISIVNQSKANIKLQGKCDSMNIKIQGDGDFDSSGLHTEELHLKHMASGNVKIQANKIIEINQLGDGSIHYSGNAVLRDISMRGKGEVKHI